MLFETLVLAAALQQQPAPPPPSPIARIRVTPAAPVIAAHDSLRLTAEALDAQGRPVPGARILFRPAGGRFEGTVDSTGLVRSGATGTLPVSVVAVVPGSRPALHRVEVRMVPGPAARVEVTPASARLVVGQRLRLSAASFSAAGHSRADPVAWTSDRPSVARVDASGAVEALAPGRARIAAADGAASGAVEVEVVPDRIARLEITPAAHDARTGDVVRFRVTARDAAGREIPGLTPAFTFSPGEGAIGPDGAFVGYEARAYTVTALLGRHSADATVTLRRRDARRPATVVGRLPRTRFATEEVWLHPNGRNAYLGSGRGGDVLYALDVSDPARC